MSNSIVKKMRIKPAAKILFINTNPELEKLILEDKSVSITTKKPADYVFVTYSSLNNLIANIKLDLQAWNEIGSFWILYPKSTSKQKFDINRDTSHASLQKMKLTTVANIAINDQWSSLRVKRV